MVQRTAGKRYKSNLHPSEQLFDKNGEWITVNKRQFNYVQESSKLGVNTYMIIKTLNDPKHQMLTVDAINMDLDNWIFACKATTETNEATTCNSGLNLSPQSAIVPSNGKRKIITLNMEELRNDFTHIVIFMAVYLNRISTLLMSVVWNIHYFYGDS